MTDYDEFLKTLRGAGVEDFKSYLQSIGKIEKREYPQIAIYLPSFHDVMLKAAKMEDEMFDILTRRLWEDGRPKEPSIIPQDAIEWDVLPTDDKSAEDGD